MRILIADDDLISRRMLQATLTAWGYQVLVACDGQEAWDALQAPDAPKLAILDWMMPHLDGPDVCKRVRATPTQEPIYMILLTSRDGKLDVVTGLQAGANDYLVKPYDRGELQARIQVGRTVVELQQKLASRVRDLEEALAQVKQLQTLLPICSYCKKIRDDKNYWNRVEDYLFQHADVKFSHGICPDCWKTEVEPQLKELA